MQFTAPMRGDMGDLVEALRAHGHPETLAIPGATVDLASPPGPVDA
jgi:hypothetical protein